MVRQFEGGTHVNAHTADSPSHEAAIPPVVDQHAWEAALAELRVREKAATRELDAIAAARRRLPMVEMPEYTLDGPDGPVRLADVFEKSMALIVYHHMWFPGEEWQCSGCTGFTSQFTRLEFLDAYDARFVIVTQGPIDDALAYKARVGNKMTWYSSAHSPFGADMGAPPDGGFQVNVFLRVGDTVYRTYNTQGRGTEQLSHLPPHRPAPIRASRGMAGLARGLAAVAHLQRVGTLRSVRTLRRTSLSEAPNSGVRCRCCLAAAHLLVLEDPEQDSRRIGERCAPDGRGSSGNWTHFREVRRAA